MPAPASPPACCAPWPGRPPSSWKTASPKVGSGRGAGGSSPTAPPSPCPIPRRTQPPTPSRPPRHPGDTEAPPPHPPQQQPGLGFPWARIAVLLSLATGACHDLAMASYTGKGTGETTLLRQLYGSLQPGDVVVGDALFDNYFLACELRQ